MGHGQRLGRQAGEVCAGFAAFADYFPVYPADFAVVLSGQHSQHLWQVFRAGLHAGVAECVAHRLCAVGGEVFRAAGDGFGLGRVLRRGAATGFPAALAVKDGFFENTKAAFRRSGGEPRNQTDGAGHFGHVGGAGVVGDQHEYRVVLAKRQRIVDVFCRPADGATYRRVGRGAGHNSAAGAVQTRRHGRQAGIFRAVGLGLAPVPAAHGAGGGGHGGAGLPAGGHAVYV